YGIAPARSKSFSKKWNVSALAALGAYNAVAPPQIPTRGSYGEIPSTRHSSPRTQFLGRVHEPQGARSDHGSIKMEETAHRRARFEVKKNQVPGPRWAKGKNQREAGGNPQAEGRRTHRYTRLVHPQPFLSAAGGQHMEGSYRHESKVGDRARHSRKA